MLASGRCWPDSKHACTCVLVRARFSCSKYNKNCAGIASCPGTPFSHHKSGMVTSNWLNTYSPVSRRKIG